MRISRFLSLVLTVSFAACSGDHEGTASGTAPPKTAPAAAAATKPAVPTPSSAEKPAAAETPATVKAEASPPPQQAAPAQPIDGEQIVRGICMACHQAGMNGAPKFADKIAWKPRIAQGRDTLYEHAMKGLRGMPPRGGNPNLNDDQVKAAVDYMVKAGGGYPN